MRISMAVGRPKIKLGSTDETPQEETIFNTKSLVLLGTGVALGIILKQQSEIQMLKRTVTIFQAVIR